MLETTRHYHLMKDEVRRLIFNQNLKRSWVAESTGIHKTTLRRWLQGKITKVKGGNVERLARTLCADPFQIAAPIL